METLADFPLTHKGVTKLFTFHFCNTPEMRAVLREKNVRGYRLDGAVPRDIMRAFRLPAEVPPEGIAHDGAEGRVIVYVNVDFPVGTMKRLAHEIGHGFALAHPDARGSGWRAHLPAIGHAIGSGFGTMSYTFLLRWFDHEGLVPMAEKVAARAASI